MTQSFTEEKKGLDFSPLVTHGEFYQSIFNTYWFHFWDQSLDALHLDSLDTMDTFQVCFNSWRFQIEVALILFYSGSTLNA